MKKIILILFLITIFISVNAQNFVPIPSDSTSYWNINGYWMFSNTCEHDYWNWYYIQGEEIINNKTYYKLYSKGTWKEFNVQPWDTTCRREGETMDVYEGALRTENNIVYFKPYDWDTEQLLFDYNYKTGDTLPDTIFFNRGNYDDLIVSSMDSVQLESGEYRTRWNLQETNFGMSFWFIEGIGTNKGLFQTLIPFEWDSELKCYSENYQTVYPPGSNCDSILNIFEKEVTPFHFNFYPNPSNGVFNLKIENPQFIHYTLEINDLTGKRLMSQDIDYHTPVKINCENIQSGIYFLTIASSRGEMATQKLVINR